MAKKSFLSLLLVNYTNFLSINMSDNQKGLSSKSPMVTETNSTSKSTKGQ